MLHITLLFVLINLTYSVELWNLKINDCPTTCTCQLQHLTDTAIYRFMQDKNNVNQNRETHREANSGETNDVLYEEDTIASDLLEEKQIIRSAVCITDSNIEPLELCDSLPADLEALTLIQGYYIGSKTVRFSFLNRFKNLFSLEVIGSTFVNQVTNSTLIVEIDIHLQNVRFMNLENVLIKNSKIQIQNFVQEIGKTQQTFEYVQTFDKNSHKLTMVQQDTNDEIVPYEKYKEQENTPENLPLFIGFKNLFLLRINHCELNSVHWSMFDGLNNLQYLIVDNNNIKFIPPFAFYGCPNLKTLSLAHNNLLDIQLTDLAGLLELEYLDLSYNNFSQLSELSLPPFPKLKLANFGNNPITTIFPNTFQVMNTTDSLIIGSNVNLSLMPNSFSGLDLLKALTLNNLNIPLLTRDFFVGMPSLTYLTLTGNIKKIDFDTFLDVQKLKKLLLNHCHIQNVSMDSFIGLENLEILDLSYNDLEELPSGIFDQLSNIKEIYLENNYLTKLPREIFQKTLAKLIRLNQNPWHCSCEMSEWKPIIINRVRQNVIRPCSGRQEFDKGVRCLQPALTFTFKYIYDNKVAPKCVLPEQYRNWSAFHFMKKILKCPEFKPKIKKKISKKIAISKSRPVVLNQNEIINKKEKVNEQQPFDNNIYTLNQLPTVHADKKYLKHKIRKIRKHKSHIENSFNFQNNNI